MNTSLQNTSKVAVVILNWNGRKFLEQFLPSVVNNNSAQTSIIVADNASTDDSISFLKQYYPNVQIIQNKTNGGYSKGYNESLKQINAEYFVLLNSDVEVTPHWIDPIIRLMDSDKSIAACQPKIRSYTNRDEFEYAGAAGGFIDKLGYPFCRGRIFDSYEKDLGQYNNNQEVFWATGACLFVRASVYFEAGGLDEDFFAHMEEIDLCWRMKNMGYKIYYCGESTVYHVGGGTLSKISTKKTFLNFRNNLILLCKNHAHHFFYLKLLQRMLMDGIAGLKFLFEGHFLHFWAVIRAHGSFYGSFLTTLKKRNEFKRKIKNFATTAIYRRSIVIDYYLKGKKQFLKLDKTKF